MCLLDATAPRWQMPALVRDEGVSSFKLFMAYPLAGWWTTARCCMRWHGAGLDALTCVHAENGPAIQAH